MALTSGDTDIHGQASVKKPRSPSPAGPTSSPASRIPAIFTGPASTPPAARNNGGGGSSGVGSNAFGQVSTKPAPIASTSAFLGGDSTYQGQLSDYQKALSDYQAQQNTQRTQYEGQYATNAKQLGQDRTQAEGGLTDDYASRGLANSGLYGKAFSDLESQYDQRQTDLDTGKATFLQGLADALNNLKTTQQSDITKAKQDALARRATSVTG